MTENGREVLVRSKDFVLVHCDCAGYDDVHYKQVERPAPAPAGADKHALYMLQKIAHDYVWKDRVCQDCKAKFGEEHRPECALMVIHAALSAAATVTTPVSAEPCRCSPPGSGEEHCTKDCYGVALSMLTHGLRSKIDEWNDAYGDYPESKRDCADELEQLISDVEYAGAVPPPASADLPDSAVEIGQRILALFDGPHGGGGDPDKAGFVLRSGHNVRFTMTIERGAPQLPPELNLPESGAVPQAAPERPLGRVPWCVAWDNSRGAICRRDLPCPEHQSSPAVPQAGAHTPEPRCVATYPNGQKCDCPPKNPIHFGAPDSSSTATHDFAAPPEPAPTVEAVSKAIDHIHSQLHHRWDEDTYRAYITMRDAALSAVPTVEAHPGTEWQCFKCDVSLQASTNHLYCGSCGDIVAFRDAAQQQSGQAGGAG